MTGKIGLLGLLAAFSLNAETTYPSFAGQRQDNYAKRTAIAVTSTPEGERLSVTCTATSAVETAWWIASKPIPVSADRGVFALGFEIRSGMDWLKCGMNNNWSTDVFWQDADGKEVGRFPLTFRFKKDETVALRFGGTIPDGAAFAVVRFGVDNPNVLPGRSIDVRKIALDLLPKGSAVPEDVFPDVEPPLVVSRFESPTTNGRVAVRYEIVDRSAVDWPSLKVADARTKQPLPFVREGNFIAVRPGESWTNGVHALTVDVRDAAGNAALARKTFLIGEKSRTPRVTLRDDGVLLVGGKPVFPIGVYGVKKLAFNAWSYDRAVADLKAAGVNFVHSYAGSRDAAFLDAVKRHGLLTWTGAGGVSKGDDWLAGVGRGLDSIAAWYVGDDTAMHLKPYELFDRDEAARMLDGSRLTCQADACHSEARESGFDAFVNFTDVFLPEIYPILGTSAAHDERCIAETIQNMKRAKDDLAKFGDGRRTHALWPILQIFDGGKCWFRYPTADEIKAQAVAALVHGGKGVLWFHYAGVKNQPDERYRYSGCFRTEEDWSTFTNLTTRIASLAPALLERDPVQPPPPTVTDGPPLDPLGQPAVTLLLKRHAGKVYVLAVNASPKPVTARLTVPQTSVFADVLWENRRIGRDHDVLTDRFGKFGVHVYRFDDPGR